MRRKRKTQDPGATQLCLFGENQMNDMVEKRLAAPAAEFLQDPGWLYWQMVIAEGSTGRAFRDQKALLTARRPVNKKPLQGTAGAIYKAE